MKDTLPAELIDRWGEVERTVFNGDFVYFPGARHEDIVNWLVEHGYTVSERSELADALQDPSDMLHG